MILEVDFQCNNNNLTPQMDPRGFNGTYEWIKIGNEKFVTEEIVYLTALLSAFLPHTPQSHCQPSWRA